MKKITGLIIGGTLSVAAAAAMAQSAAEADSNLYSYEPEPRTGYVYDNYAGYAPDEESLPVKTDAPGVETVNRGGEARSAWQSDDGRWIDRDAGSSLSGPTPEVIVGDPDVAEVFGRG